MKLMFASDIHGSRYWCERMMERYTTEAPEKLILLGDLLYHGPRNDLPRDYDPKAVIAMLNSIKEHIIAVRGNCDAEVDQMVLNFPITADYFPLLLDGKMIFCTHGHLYDYDKMPSLGADDIVIYGHTHLYTDEFQFGHRFINPGSVSLPKEGRVNSYMTYENEKFTLKDMDGSIVL